VQERRIVRCVAESDGADGAQLAAVERDEQADRTGLVVRAGDVVKAAARRPSLSFAVDRGEQLGLACGLQDHERLVELSLAREPCLSGREPRFGRDLVVGHVRKPTDAHAARPGGAGERTRELRVPIAEGNHDVVAATLGTLDLEREIAGWDAHAATVLDDERMRVVEDRSDRLDLSAGLARTQHQRHVGVAQPIECRSRGLERIRRVIEQAAVQIGHHDKWHARHSRIVVSARAASKFGVMVSGVTVDGHRCEGDFDRISRYGLNPTSRYSARAAALLLRTPMRSSAAP